MIVNVSKDIRIIDPTPTVCEWIKSNLVLRNPLYQKMKAMGKDETIRRKHIPQTISLCANDRGELIIPFGCAKAVWPFIGKAVVNTSFNDSGDMSIKNDKISLPDGLYDYQEEAVQAMQQAKGGVLVSPAGSGKTYMGIELAKRIGKKTLWLCHTGDLLRQAKSDILTLYPNAKIGLTTEGKLEIGEDFTVSTVQTMVKIDPSLYKDKFDVVICDECAHVVSAHTDMKMFGEVLSNIPARYKYGLTATPKRADGMIKAMYIYLGANNEHLFDPTFKIDRSRVKTIEAIHEKVELVSGFSLSVLYKITDTTGTMVYNKLIDYLTKNNERTEKIIQNVIAMDKEGRKQVILCSRVEHCKYITERLQELGYSALLCVGKVSAKKREAILTQKVDWNIIVSTYSLLKEGVSVKDFDTLHLATPIKDRATIVQCAGRIERYKEDKNQPIVFDYVDTEIPYCEKIYIERRRALKRRF